MKNFKPSAWLLPQPVLIIGTYDENGQPNAMNAAWGGQWDYHQIMISMGTHATTRNLNLNNEFTIAFATVDTMIEADYVGVVSALKNPDKIKNTHWTVEKAPSVNAPLFKEFPFTMECRIKEKLFESETGYYIIADIINILCDDKYLASDGKPDVEKMNLITFDPIHNNYIALGQKAGNAFSDGLKLK